MNMFAIIDREITRQGGTFPGLQTGGVIRNRQTIRIKNPLVGIRSLSEKMYVKTRHGLRAFLGS
jgi:hypothetical protein